MSVVRTLTPPRVARGKLASHVYDTLREAIISLELKPGQPLDKHDLALQYDVSRTPISEALSRLQSEALVDVVPQRGTKVSLIKLSDARQNMFLRRAMEVEVVRTITATISAADIARLEQNLYYQDATLAARDRHGFLRLDFEFHAILFDALGFERLKVVAETARLGLDRVRQLLNTPRRQEVTMREHLAIVNAISAKNPDRAAAAMGAHLDAVMDELESFAAANTALFADLAFKHDGQA